MPVTHRRLIARLGATLSAALCALLLLLSVTAPVLAADTPPRVRISTSLGDIVVELDPIKAPQSVNNFLAYAQNGFYEGTIFHRVIDGFMIQGGGFTADYQKKATRPAIANEANNGLKNVRGSIAMARTNEPNSATSQFFINVVDNDFLNHRAPTLQGWGYAVFGKVIEGMSVVDAMRQLPTGSGGPFRSDVPRTAVIITKVMVESALPAPAATPAPLTPAAPAKPTTRP